MNSALPIPTNHHGLCGLCQSLFHSAEPALVTESGNVRIVVGEGKHISINVGGVETNLDELDNNMKALDKAALTDSTAAMLLGECTLMGFFYPSHIHMLVLC
jgi:hypothetical protein